MTRARSAPWRRRAASTSSAATAWAWPIRGIRCASAARSAATARATRCAERLDRDPVQLGRLHHHHRAVPAHGRLGHDHAGIERQGRLHPLRRTRVRLRTRQRRSQQGGGAVLRARRLLRARRRVHQAGGGLRGRPLEEQAHARGRPCRRDVRRRRRRGVEGTLVHAEVRRGRAVHARAPGVFGQGRGGGQHRRHPGGADRGDGGQRRQARLRARGHDGAEGLVRLQLGVELPPELDLPVVRAVAPYDMQVEALEPAASAPCSRARH